MTTLDQKLEHLSLEYLENRLEEDLKVAAENDSPYAVLAFVPQHLPGEHVADIVRTVEDCVHGLIRGKDAYGRISDEVIAVGLAGTDATEARAFASRLTGVLRLRSAHLRNTVWEAGYACRPQDGETAKELLRAAVMSAKTRRSRLAP